MAARGSSAKATITETILKTFEGSFLYNGGKELRIPMEDNGGIVEIKVTLTCAKENVGTAEVAATGAAPLASAPATPEVTPEEAKEVKEMLLSFGF